MPAYCTNCHLPLHESRSHNWKDRVMRILGYHPARCHRCTRRFYKRPQELTKHASGDPSWKD